MTGSSALLKRGENFLRLAQGIAKKHGRFALLERLEAKLYDRAKRLLGRRKLIARQPVGGLHDQRFRVRIAAGSEESPFAA